MRLSPNRFLCEGCPLDRRVDCAGIAGIVGICTVVSPCTWLMQQNGVLCSANSSKIANLASIYSIWMIPVRLGI